MRRIFFFEFDGSALYEITEWNSNIDRYHADFGRNTLVEHLCMEIQNFQRCCLTIQLWMYHFHLLTNEHKEKEK